MTRRRVTGIALTLSLALTAIFATSSHAAFHLVKVREVHKGTAITGDYVMLQMYEAGQNLFGGHHVRFLDGTGNVLADYTLNNVANGQNQRTYLLGNTGVAGADQTEAGVNVATNGAVCYNELGLGMGGIDCVAWGTFTQTVENLSSPGLPAFGTGLAGNQSLVRTIARGCATALDAPDDTNNSAADFSLAAPIGRPNATAPTEVECKPTVPVKKKKCKKKKRKKKGSAKKSHADDAAKKKKKKRCGKKKKKKT
jgi:hypothetical protein